MKETPATTREPLPKWLPWFPYRSSSVVILTWLLCNGTIKVAQFSFQRKSNKYLILEDIQLHRCFFSWDLHNETYHIMLLKMENDTRHLFVLVKVFIVKSTLTVLIFDIRMKFLE